MDRQTRRLFLAAIGIVAIVAAVAAFAGRPGADGRPAAPTIDGVVIQVESSGLGSVSGFTLRSADGREVRFGLAELQNAVQFAPGHLAEHVATSAPVRVWYRESAGGFEALWLEDALAATRPT